MVIMIIAVSNRGRDRERGKSGKTEGRNQGVTKENEGER
jgi:hypothetical protein